MSFQVNYNGMQLLGILTPLFDQDTVRDDSNTDTWYHKFTLEVETVANIAVFAAQNRNLGIVGNRVQGASAAEVCRNIQSRFEDRKAFQFIQDGTILLQSDVTTDANNGPRVNKVSVKPCGSGSMRIRVVFEISKIVCTDNPSPVIGNRWQVVDDIDDQWRTTRTTRGKLRLCNAVHNPQAFRHLVVPQLSDGFQRVRMHFQGELNALELSYEVVDRQLLGDAPPAPGLRLTGTHTESLTRNGMSSVGEVFVRLDGPPGADHQVLIEQAVRIIGAKLQAAKFAAKKDAWIWHELIITDYFGNESCSVDARARVQRSVDARADGGEALVLGNMLMETLGRPLDLGGDYNRFRVLAPALYPTTTIGLFACHLQSPCEDNHAMPQAANRVDGGGDSPGQSNEEPTYNVTYDPSGEQVEIDSPGLNSDQVEAMYTFTSVEWLIETDEGYVAMPYGDQLPASDATVANIRLYAPVAKLHVKIAAERIGEWPKIPEKKRFGDSAGITYTPLKYRPNFRPPEYQGDGRKLYVIDLDATFSMSRAPSSNQYVVPSLPWDDLGPTQIPSQTFVPVT